jgi:phenylacetate-coenzyme A ligase PaaK-like adenylate-forming protein
MGEGADKYWNPILKTTLQEKLRALQLRKLKRIMQKAMMRDILSRTLCRRE